MSAKPKPTLEGDLAAEIRAVQLKARSRAGATISFPDFLTSPEYAGGYFAASNVAPSPVVLAIAQASEGRAPTAIDEDTCRAVFNCEPEAFGARRPKVVDVSAGRRGGKTSSLLATKAVHAAWSTPLPNLKPGEEAASVVISPILDLARAAFNYAKGIVTTSPILSNYIDKMNETEIVLARPHGGRVVITTKAADGKGSGARSFSYVFVGLDEACFFYAGDGYTKNDTTIYNSALPALNFIPEAQCWIVSTPWVEGEGLLEKHIAEAWGNPGFYLVAARISSYLLRGISDDGSLAEGLDEDTYKREILALPLPSGSTSFFNLQHVARSLERLTPDTLAVVAKGAGGDVALERDLSAAAIVRRLVGGIFDTPADGLAVADARAEGLRGSEVAARLAAPVLGAGLRSLLVDGHSFAAMAEHFEKLGVWPQKCPITPEFKIESWTALRDLFAEDRINLGALSEANRDMLRYQLAQVAAKRSGGRYEICIPRATDRQIAQAAARGKNIRGHADAVAALVLAASEAGSMDRARWGEMPRRPYPPPTTPAKSNPQRPRAFDPRRIGRLR